MVDDKAFSGEFFSIDKSTVLMQIFNKIQPCIEHCIFTQYGTTKYEMLENYYYIYEKCRSIIIRSIQMGLNYPPSAFSAAVHQHVVHNRLYKDFKWCVVSAFFEYAAMQMTGDIYQTREKPTEEQHKRAVWDIVTWLWPSHHEERIRDVEKSVEKAQSEQAEAAKINGWRLPSNRSIDPAETVMQVHENVHKTNEKLDEILSQLQVLLAKHEQG
jgi:hypothetical protein